MKLATLALLLAPTVAPAQNPIRKIVAAGDVTAIGNVTQVNNLTIGSDGGWLVECDTNHALVALDEVLLSPAGIVQREGDHLNAPAGATLLAFDGLSAPATGQLAQNLLLGATGGTNNDSGVFWNGNLTIQEGFVSTAPQFSPGTPYLQFWEVKSSGNHQILIMANVEDPAIPNSPDLALVRATVDANGALLSESVVAKEGDIAPGQTNAITGMGLGPHSFAFNANGQAIFTASLNGPSLTNAGVWLDNTLVALEGSPSGIPGRNWLALSMTRVSLNNTGGWVMTGTLEPPTSSDLAIVSSAGKVAQEGDPVPGQPGFVFTGFGTGAVLIADNGDVFWYGEWNDVATQNAGWFRNQTLLVRKGIDTCAGQVITGLESGFDNASLTPSGQGLLFEALLQISGSAALLFDSTPPAVLYCTPKTNSQGCVPGLDWSGYPSAAQSSGFTVFSFDTLNNKPGLLLHGVAGQAATPFSGGTLCIAPPVRRSVGVASGGNPPPNDCSGVLSIDLNAYARGALGGNPIPELSQLGQVVDCQWWGRDNGFPPPNNTTLSEGLEYTVGF